MIDDAILACHFESTLALLDGYAIGLQSGRQADNMVARIGTAETAPFPQIDPRTRDPTSSSFPAYGAHKKYLVSFRGFLLHDNDYE